MARALTARQRSDFEWFKFKMPELYREFGHCFAVISDRKVLATCPTYGEAVESALETLSFGDFIVQEVGETAEAYTAAFTSMWVMA